MKAPPASEMYLGRQKQKGKEQHLDGIGADLQSQGRSPLSSSGPSEFFLRTLSQSAFVAMKTFNHSLTLVS